MTTSAQGSEKWAEQEFGSAELGNSLRTMRLRALAAGALEKPAGVLTEVFEGSGEREGAYKFIESDKVSPQEIRVAACRAAAGRARGMPFVFVPVDGSSLSLREYAGEAARGVGSVGSRAKRGTGVEVMNAVVIDPLGVPLGLFSQEWWVRGQRVTVPARKRKLPEKETRHWFGAMEGGLREWKKANPTTRPWFQLDRGGDFREALSWAATSEEWVTIRAAYDRRTTETEERYLWATLEATESQGTVTVELPATKIRKARRATLELRHAPVTLRLRNPWTNTVTSATLGALLACERSNPADGSEPVEWMLLTNRAMQSKADAELVLFGYTQRWRIEQFHRTWKSVCHVEQTQLRDLPNIERWATVLASVAMRLLRLTYLSRVSPNLPASDELSKAELFALVVEKGKGIYRPGDEIPLDVATQWIAQLGGYTGVKSSGGPPGTTVLARGLRHLASMTDAITKLLAFVG